MERGAVERPLTVPAVGLAVGVGQAGGQWARDRGGLVGATMSPERHGCRRPKSKRFAPA